MPVKDAEIAVEDMFVMVAEGDRSSEDDASPKSWSKAVDEVKVSDEVPVMVEVEPKKATWFAVGAPEVVTPVVGVDVTYLLPRASKINCDWM